MNPYNKSFFQHQREGSSRSAQAVLPGVLDLVQPASLVDVGCGVGTWLAAAKQLGVEDVVGIDGPWVDRTLLSVPENCFETRDLREPIDLGRRFDLVMSMEVAEHLPPEAADVFVDNLTSLGPVILFSAAAPYQGGTQHYNEQWPLYWVDKFARRDYVAIDCVRRAIWRNPDVDWHYAQNSLVFAERRRAESCPRLREAHAKTTPEMLSVVHPQALQYMRFKSAVKVLGAAARRAVRRRLGLRVARRPAAF